MFIPPTLGNGRALCIGPRGLETQRLLVAERHLRVPLLCSLMVSVDSSSQGAMETLGSPPPLSDNSMNVDITLVHVVLCWSVSTPNTPRGLGLYSPASPAGPSLVVTVLVVSTPSIFNMSFSKCILFHSTASFLGFFFISNSFLILLSLGHTPTLKNPFIFFSVTFFSPPSRQHWVFVLFFPSHSSFYLKFNGLLSAPLSSSLLWATAQRSRGGQVQIRRFDPAIFREGDSR